MQPFDFQLKTRVVFGPGELNQVGVLTRGLGKRVLLVSDPGIVAAGHVELGMKSLRDAGLDVRLFDGAQENPTTDNIDQGLAVAKDFQPEVIVGLGGGSSMDCAKGINFVFTNGGTMHDYHGVGKANRPMLPMVAVPTTSGTGSEMQSFALISDAKTHVKMACGDKKASCRIAILDPELTLTQPAAVTALTGVDAISHAVETYVTKRRNPISLHYSREAWRLLAGNFRQVLANPSDLAARSAMQLGAAYAGVAIENSMLGAAHALANPLTATYGIAHGQAVGMMLPHVVRFNGVDYDSWYRELLVAGAAIEGMPESSTGAQGLASFLTELVVAAGLHVKLEQSGVENEKIAALSEAASQQWTGSFNPRDLDQSSLQSIYRNAF